MLAEDRIPSPTTLTQVPTVVNGEMEALASILGPDGQQGCRRGAAGMLLLDAPVDGMPPGGERGRPSQANHSVSCSSF